MWHVWQTVNSCILYRKASKGTGMGTPQITHLVLKTSSCSAPPPGQCELCVSLQEPRRSRNDSECELDERW